MTNPITTNGKSSPVLKVENLAIAYKVRGGEIEAVQDVSFDVGRGEAYGIVGESGCGKSTVAWALGGVVILALVGVFGPKMFRSSEPAETPKVEKPVGIGQTRQIDCEFDDA